MKNDIAKVDAKGQLVIPSRLRRRFGIRQGTRVAFLEEDHRIVLQPLTPQFARLAERRALSFQISRPGSQARASALGRSRTLTIFDEDRPSSTSEPSGPSPTSWTKRFAPRIGWWSHNEVGTFAVGIPKLELQRYNSYRTGM